ncbi:MAG: extracellular solute-binding protein [Limnochordia bacterium]|jgi:multiple sugar transport system substrate-binding protein
MKRRWCTPTAVCALLVALAVRSPAATVTWWHVWGEARNPLVEHMITNFEKENPRTKVEHLVIPQAGMYEKYLQAIAGGSPPDVIMISRTMMPSFAEQGALLPLDNLAARDNLVLEDIFYPGEVAISRFLGKTWALPGATAGGHSVLWWDKDLLDLGGLDSSKGPVTWREYRAFGKKLTVETSDGRIRRLGALPDGPGFPQWLYTNGGRLLSDDGRRVACNSAEGVETLEWLQGWVNEIGGYNRITDWSSTYVPGRPRYEKWWAGSLAMVIDGVWLFFQNSEQAPHVDYGVGLMPYNDTNSQAESANILDGTYGWSYAIPTGAKNTEGAWMWIKYITYGDGNRSFFTSQMRPSAARRVNQDPLFRKDNPYWGIVGQVLAGGIPVTLTPKSSQVLSILNSSTASAIQGKQAARPALEDGARRAQAILDEWWSGQ